AGGGVRGRSFHRGTGRPAALYRRLSRRRQRAQLGAHLRGQGGVAGAGGAAGAVEGADPNTGPSLQEELIWPLIRTLWTMWPSSCGSRAPSAAGRCSGNTASTATTYFSPSSVTTSFLSKSP